jgi:hypothetical protein
VTSASVTLIDLHSMNRSILATDNEVSHHEPVLDRRWSLDLLCRGTHEEPVFHNAKDSDEGWPLARRSQAVVHSHASRALQGTGAVCGHRQSDRFSRAIGIKSMVVSRSRSDCWPPHRKPEGSKATEGNLDTVEP